MATMVKEKNSKKKKSKKKSNSQVKGDIDSSVNVDLSKDSEPHLVENANESDTVGTSNSRIDEEDSVVSLLNEELNTIENIAMTTTNEDVQIPSTSSENDFNVQSYPQLTNENTNFTEPISVSSIDFTKKNEDDNTKTNISNAEIPSTSSEVQVNMPSLIESNNELPECSESISVSNAQHTESQDESIHSESPDVPFTNFDFIKHKFYQSAEPVPYSVPLGHHYMTEESHSVTFWEDKKYLNLLSNNAQPGDGIYDSSESISGLDGPLITNFVGLSDEDSDCSFGCDHGKLADKTTMKHNLQNLTPTAPTLYEQTFNKKESPVATLVPESIERKHTVKYLSIKEASKIFHRTGNEMLSMKEISADQESWIAVKSKFFCHTTLVDLIVNLREHLRSLDKLRHSLSQGYFEEQNTRSNVWVVEKKSSKVSKKCLCGANVDLNITYEVAERQDNWLLTEIRKLESLSKNVFEKYCCHQHEAILSYHEIQEIVASLKEYTKEEVRADLVFIFNTLNACEDSDLLFSKLLTEWAAIYAARLFILEPDVKDMVFFMHLMCRQTRSVKWVEHVMQVQLGDVFTPSHLISFLELLLIDETDLNKSLPSNSSAMSESQWTELVLSGHGDEAVGRGRLRERDLLAVLKTLPLRDMIGSLMLLSREEMEGNHGAEWSGALACGMVLAVTGVRLLLSVIERALPVYNGYPAVSEFLIRLVLSTLRALEALHLRSREQYTDYMEITLLSELEGCFAAGYECLYKDGPHGLPANLLREETAVDYCATIINGVHGETGVYNVESMDLVVYTNDCNSCLRTVVQVAAQRPMSDLVHTVMAFLFQIGVKGTVHECNRGCVSTARQQLATLIAAHPNMHTVSLLMLADVNKVEIVDPVLLKYFVPAEWRPPPSEVTELLSSWSVNCPSLIPHLLEEIDSTPYSGMCLESQLAIGRWLCSYTNTHTETPEWAWRCLRRLCVHRARWGLSLDTFTPDSTKTHFEIAFALLASDWGHSVPLVCSKGVGALQQLASTRLIDAVHCLDNVMRVLAQSPESVSLTPEFTNLFNEILNTGPSLMERALGRASVSGLTLLQRLISQHMTDESLIANNCRGALLSAWLHALWNPALPTSSRLILETAMRSARDWDTLGAFVKYLFEEVGGSRVLRDMAVEASTCPLLAAAALRQAEYDEQQTGILERLVPVLGHQQRRGERVHVDNALKEIGAKITSEDLLIHQAVACALVAPLQDPSHLMIWCMFITLYLKRHRVSKTDKTEVACGPLLFSGIRKSLVMNQIKKRLQETATYHRNAVQPTRADTPETSVEPEPEHMENTVAHMMKHLFPPITRADLIGDPDIAPVLPSESYEEELPESDDAVQQSVKVDNVRLLSYHRKAEKMILLYERWLNENESVLPPPHQAVFHNFFEEQDVDAAWNASCESVVKNISPKSPSPDERLRFVRPPATTHYEQIINAINTFKFEPKERVSLDAVSAWPVAPQLSDQDGVFAQVQKLLKSIEKLMVSWSSDAEQLMTLDMQLCQCLGRLYQSRQLPTALHPCPKCQRPIFIQVEQQEWCLSTAVASDIENNRRSALQLLRRLVQPKISTAQITAGILSISRCINNKRTAFLVLSAVYRNVQQTNAPAHHSLIRFIDSLAEKWVCSDGAACVKLLERWCNAGAYQLCGALVRPQVAYVSQWRVVYLAVLRLPLPPDIAFSYLSRFDVIRWNPSLSEAHRSEIIETLVEATKRWSEKKENEYQMLVELAGLHCARLCHAKNILRYAHECWRAAVSPRGLPLAYLTPLAALVASADVHFNGHELALLLSQLGAIWTEKRESAVAETTTEELLDDGRSKSSLLIADMSAIMAHQLRLLSLAHTRAAISENIEPEIVAQMVWKSLIAAWSPWIEPRDDTLLPISVPHQKYSVMVNAFIDTLLQLFNIAPPCQRYLMEQAWQWTVQASMWGLTHVKEARVQAHEVLKLMRRLPWNSCPWLTTKQGHLLIEACSTNSPELNSFCNVTMNELKMDNWIETSLERRGQGELPLLFEMFTAKYLQLLVPSIDVLTYLPWHMLSVEIVEDLLKNYFMRHYNTRCPYHSLPHFELALTIGGLKKLSFSPTPIKRCVAVSTWARAAMVPALLPHMGGFTHRLLNIVQEVAQTIPNQDDHVLELLGCAMVTLSTEAAAAEALRSWKMFARQCGPRVRTDCVRAVGLYADMDIASPLIDTLAEVALSWQGSGGWCEVTDHMCSCLTVEPSSLIQRGQYHAAYALLRARPLPPNLVLCIVSALSAFPVKFTFKEAIVAVWICALCRMVCEFNDPDVDTPPDVDDDERLGLRKVTEEVCSLLIKWAELKLSLFNRITKRHPNVPTLKHRLLCLLSLCVIQPSQLIRDQSKKDYEMACQGAVPLGIKMSEVRSWGHEPHRKRVPQLALMLFPENPIYFKAELDDAGGS